MTVDCNQRQVALSDPHAMFYGSTILATDFAPDSWQVKVLKAVLCFIPEANPDNGKLYRQVKKWYLELDEDGVPVREIGLDSEGKPLFGAPDRRNTGFWTDSPKVFQRDEVSPISAEEFERLWIQVGSRD